MEAIKSHDISTLPARKPAKASRKKSGGAQQQNSAVPPRRMKFDFNVETAERYFYKSDPFLSAFWLTMSTLFPAGETFFIDSVRHYRDRIKDPALQEEIAGFIGQEAMHRKVHMQYNDMGKQQGYPTKVMEKVLGGVLGGLQRFTPKIFQLATTVCLEHYTAIAAEQLLRDPEHQSLADPEALKIWLWHALEENEHKSVAFDVYQEVSGNYLLRAGAMVPTTVIYFAVITAFMVAALASDRRLFDIPNHLRGLEYLFGSDGLFTRLKEPYLDFYRRDFHPTQHDTVELLAEWREKLFGESGILAREYQPANA